MPRDNLLNSACLELFEFVRREFVKPIVKHLVENYRSRLEEITYVSLFQDLISKYDQMQAYNPEMEGTLFGREEDNTPVRTRINGSQRWQGVREMDTAEEEYFNTSDDEDELAAKPKMLHSTSNGVSPISKPLVDYPDDDDESAEIKFHDFETKSSGDSQHPNPLHHTSPRSTTPIHQSPPERLSEKRRREEDEEDELGKLSLNKRRTSSISSNTSTNSNSTNLLRRKRNFIASKDAKKIAITLAVKSPIEMERGGDDGG